MRRLVLVAALVAGCGVAAPSRVDLAALVKRLGPVEARHALEVRIVRDPQDLGARLALAKLCEEQGRPSQAIEQLEVVVRAGGPVGTRWRDEDRARFGRLLAARGEVRLARGAPTALADLERARGYGARVGADDLVAAQLARAIVELRHVDAKQRARGLAALRATGRAPADTGELGIYLWSVGAKRAAYEALARSTSRDERILRARLVARTWWTPVDGPPPSAGELVGPERCRHGGCDPWELVQNGISSAALDALVLAPSTPTRDPEEAYAWLAITLAQTLRGDDTGSWAARFASRVDLATVTIDRIPPGGRAAFALVTGGDAPPDGSDRSPPGRFLAAAVVAFRGGTLDDVRAALGPFADTPDGAALLAIATPPALEPVEAPYAAAVARYIAARVGEAPRDVTAILRAYRVDPLRAERFARDAVAASPDAASAHAWLGALYDAIADPARARASWHAAVDASPEPAHVRSLAEAIARAGDPDAALVFGTQAAAASGDPSPVWIGVAEALHANGSDVHALEAARYAIDLATAETAARAFAIAIAASGALGRAGQVSELRARRARLSPPVLVERAEDRTREPRWNPRDVASRVALLEQLAGDPRRNAVIADLVRLAGDPDGERGRAAVRALGRLE